MGRSTPVEFGRQIRRYLANLPGIDHIWPICGRNRPSSTRSGLGSAKFGPNMINFGQTSATFDTHWPDVDQDLLGHDQLRPQIDDVRPEIGQTRPNLARSWRSLAQGRPNLAWMRPHWARTRPRPTLVWKRPKCWSRPSLTRIRPNLGQKRGGRAIIFPERGLSRVERSPSGTCQDACRTIAPRLEAERVVLTLSWADLG